MQCSRHNKGRENKAKTKQATHDSGGVCVRCVQSAFHTFRRHCGFLQSRKQGTGESFCRRNSSERKRRAAERRRQRAGDPVCGGRRRSAVEHIAPHCTVQRRPHCGHVHKHSQKPQEQASVDAVKAHSAQKRRRNEAKANATTATAAKTGCRNPAQAPAVAAAVCSGQRGQRAALEAGVYAEGALERRENGGNGAMGGDNRHTPSGGQKGPPSHLNRRCLPHLRRRRTTLSTAQRQHTGLHGPAWCRERLCTALHTPT